MAISAFDLFSIGIGPSSSHTVGPMRAARLAVLACQKLGILSHISCIKVDLYGSLALTGKGHATDMAITLGLTGESPEGIDPALIQSKMEEIRNNEKIILLDEHLVIFHPEKNIVFHCDKQLPYHPNGMRFNFYDQTDKLLSSQIYYSVGGGFVVDHDSASKDEHLVKNELSLPYSFYSGKELLELCRKHHLTIAELMMENEKSWRSAEEVKSGLLYIWDVMEKCIQRGCKEEGVLPGGLNVKRRAAGLFKSLTTREDSKRHVAEVMEWVSLWALAVNEENAAGGRVVTAPTNGAAGVLPAVIHYYLRMTEKPSYEGIITFMLVAAAIGILYKENASISAAEMGCMGEVGVACSMAAAGLTAAMGGTNEQVENAAEIGMEHNLGLTCDPVMGLVQIPCIERNTMGAIKAINASLLALQGDGRHRVSLDQVIETMRQTGQSMSHIFKETSLGGLAVNVPEC